jgi:hypothetical protein
MAPETREEFYGADAGQLLFAYLDAQTLGGQFSQAQFWEYALRPLHEQAVVHERDTPLTQAYALCQENNFGTFVLERLLAQMEQASWCLVLMLDEFDLLLQHPILNSSEFFGSLRSLASRSRGVLTLVVASRCPLKRLNEDTQELGRTGSPYFNILIEVLLGTFPAKYVSELLRLAADRFSADDRHFVKEVAGGHPYLLQAAASTVWDIHEDGVEDGGLRLQRAGQDLHAEVADALGDTWDSWTPKTRWVMVTVGLAHLNAVANQAGRVHPSQYDLGSVRSLVMDTFAAEELERFCRDRYIFSPVLDKASSNAGLEEMADVLISYCYRRLLFPELIWEIQEFNPRQYRHHAARLVSQSSWAWLAFGPELRSLVKQGFVAKDETVVGGWRVRPLVLLWWLVDELAQATRSRKVFQEWLQYQSMDDILTPKEQRWLDETSRVIGEMFPGGVTDLIEAAVTDSDK